jgi:prolipoprotein diacylglyceryltransferase
MSPILFAVGPITVYNLSIFVILAWIAFSFVFWQKLKNSGVEDEKIFDLTFYGTLVAFVCARATYVLFNLGIFADNLLKTIAVWVVPGLSLFGALIGLTVTYMVMVKRSRIRLSYVIDALGLALVPAFLLGNIGTLLDGTMAGVGTGAPWAVRYIGYVGMRHPVQVYTIIALFIISLILMFVERQSQKRKWPYGIVGIVFFLLFSLTQFMVEFVTDHPQIWGNLTLNQWVLVAIFSEALGACYVKVGGKQKLRSLVKETYAKFSKRRT